jgi:branched-chain amino acid transport system permease protein
MVLRATSEDPEMTELHGWSVQRVRAATWALAGALAGVAGVLIAVRVPVEPEYMVAPLIKAFIAGIVGGLERIVAPMAVAIGIGLVENWGGSLFGAQFRVPAVFLGAILVLAIVPREWLAGKREARA